MLGKWGGEASKGGEGGEEEYAGGKLDDTPKRKRMSMLAWISKRSNEEE